MTASLPLPAACPNTPGPPPTVLMYCASITSRDLKPHNILLAATDRKGPGLGRRLAGSQQAEGGGGGGEKGEGNGPQVAPRKLANMRDLAKFVLKISDMGLGKQLLNGQSRCAVGFFVLQGRRKVKNLCLAFYILYCLRISCGDRMRRADFGRLVY